MARLQRICPVGIPQHIIQRGNNRQVCFASEMDFSAYANWLKEAADKHQVDIHAWVLMTNHVHLLATPNRENGISQMMQIVGRQYVRYFNHAYRRTGTLWEGRFKSCVIDAENYLLVCQRYIELNPVRAGMVESPVDYEWSSYQANSMAKPSRLWTPHPIWLSLGKDNHQRAKRYRELFAGHVAPDVLYKLRDSVNKGMALGNDRFKSDIEALTGRRVSSLRRGPKQKKKEAVCVLKDREFLL
ncbi:MAG: transposase [Sedimenticola sp.]